MDSVILLLVTWHINSTWPGRLSPVCRPCFYQTSSSAEKQVRFNPRWQDGVSRADIWTYYHGVGVLLQLVSCDGLPVLEEEVLQEALKGQKGHNAHWGCRPQISLQQSSALSYLQLIRWDVAAAVCVVVPPDLHQRDTRKATNTNTININCHDLSTFLFSRHVKCSDSSWKWTNILNTWDNLIKRIFSLYK